MSNMVDWAKREVEFAVRELEEDTSEDICMNGYVESCYNSALKAFNSLCEDGHSGMSIGVTKNILNRLIDGSPLTPIKEEDDCWVETRDNSNNNYKTYQCSRMSSLFKDVYDDGTVKYKDVNRFSCYELEDPDDRYHSGLVDTVMGEIIPITFPYSGMRVRVGCMSMLTDLKNGDFDTVAIIRYELDGNKINVERFFKESETRGKYGRWEEITREEWNERCILSELLEAEIAEQNAEKFMRPSEV